MALTGHDSNFVGYLNNLVLQPGETRTLLRFVVVGYNETSSPPLGGPTPAAGSQIAVVKAAAQGLVTSPPVADLTTTEICNLINWVPASLTAADCSQVAPHEQQGDPQILPATTSSPYDVVDKTIQQMRADMESGATTSAEITRAYLDRIAAYDTGQLGFHSMTVIAEDAMGQAREADRMRALGETGPLLGIPVAVKDLYDTKDMPTTNGSLVFEDFRPTKDATQVALMRAAGAVIIGKATMSEYANSGHFSDSAWGQVWNAFEPSKSSIGSSGGSGVSTALSFNAFSMGSQTGDSLWGPSSAASLYSLRGTDGMTSNYGAMPLTWLQDYTGAITRSVSDLADVLNVTTGADPKDFAPSKPTRGVPPTGARRWTRTCCRASGWATTPQPSRTRSGRRRRATRCSPRSRTSPPRARLSSRSRRRRARRPTPPAIAATKAGSAGSTTTRSPPTTARYRSSRRRSACPTAVRRRTPAPVR